LFFLLHARGDNEWDRVSVKIVQPYQATLSLLTKVTVIGDAKLEAFCSMVSVFSITVQGVPMAKTILFLNA
jgi:hypothetical protein